ncbi:predicted protein [Naegleria gruberi]|uniref:non-specific serine/threonine protein kinase n=1 Tax=Naegleria gruberi TaxID=5762 RepID=D2VHM4_NAEGR|nr:uncharacterized protein NAEGRDRAFT_79999 [Naegleria gruberi]EFC43613.1 predicted protein [Naegleria gruberi]|eukprot:XP_002676357.1 predicted protein [Naegleria gruberi strain NEG-M]
MLTQKYNPKMKLGSGAEGLVYLVEEKSTNKLFAIKMITLFEEENFEKIKKEVDLVRKFHEHNNIVRYFDYFEERTIDAFAGVELRLFFVMEYCDKGSLETIIQEYLKEGQHKNSGSEDLAADKHLPFSFIISTIKQLTSVLVYIHNQQIVHRDLKPANLLFKAVSSTNISITETSNESTTTTTTAVSTSKEQHSTSCTSISENDNIIENCKKEAYNDWVLKLSDFGFTKQMKDNMAQSFVGTIQYMSPELFSSKKYDAGTDIWSFGVCILRMFAFLDETKVPDLRHEIKKDSEFVCKLCKKYKAPKVVEEIVYACLLLDPTDRPTAAEISQFLEEFEKSGGTVSLLKKVKFTPPPSSQNLNDQNGMLDVSITMDDELSSSSSSDGSLPLEKIINDKAREFWKQHSWERRVNWMDFREAYINLIQQLKIEEKKNENNEITTESPGINISYTGISMTDFMRGLKTGVCNKYFDTVSIEDLNELTKQAGFPFNPEYVINLAAYEITDDKEVDIEDVTMDTETFMRAQSKYLETILTCDKVFIDPISQEPLQIDQHLAPLELVETNEWNDLLKTEQEIEEDDEKKTKVERGSSQYYEDAVDFLSSTSDRPLKYLILGSAACGKTCMMKRLCYKAAQSAYKRAGDTNSFDLVPLMVPVANIPVEEHDNIPFKLKCIRASADTFNKGLKYSADVEKFLLNVWQCGRLLLLLDGLDEGGENRAKLEKQICKLNFRELGGILTTSRVSGFEQEEAKNVFDSFKIARIKPLTYQIQKQVALSRGLKDPKFFQSLQKYKELAKIPLLLSLMIQEYKQNKELPDIRSVLYDHACETMISVYIDKVRPHTTKQERRDLFEMLYAVASILHDNTKRYFTSAYIEKHLQEITTIVDLEASANNSVTNGSQPPLSSQSITNANNLTANESGTNFSSSSSEPSRNVYETWKTFHQDIDDGHFPLIIRLGNNYSFAHLSFQEYFVAKVWSDARRVSRIREQKKGRLNFFSRKKENLPIVFSSETKKLIIDPWFRETFLICAGSMSRDDFNEFINYLSENFKKSSAIDNLLLQMIRTERPSDERDQYSEIEKNITTQKKLKNMILEGLIHDSSVLREMTTKRVALYESDLTNVIAYLLKVVTKNKDKTKSATHSLLDIFQQLKDDKEFRYRTTKRLIESLADKQWKIGEQSVIALLAIAEKEDTRITKKLWTLMTKPPIEVQVRACYAISVLAKRGDSKFINKFMEILLSETIKEGRYMDKMIESLTNICVRADEIVLSQIRSNIKQAQNKLIRHGLITALGKISAPGDKQTIKLLVQILSKEKSSDTLTFVVDALKMVCEARETTNLSIAIKLLKDHIAYRPDKSLREEYEEYEFSFNDLNQKIMELIQALLLGREYSKRDTKDMSLYVKGLTEQLNKDSNFKKLVYELYDTMFTLAITGDSQIRKTTVSTFSAMVDHNDEELLTFIFDKIKNDLLKNIMTEDKSMEITTVIFLLGVVFANTANSQAINVLLELLESNSSNAYLLGEIFTAMGNVAPRNDTFLIEMMTKYLEMEKDAHMQEKELWKLKSRIISALENICLREENNERLVTKMLQLLEVCPQKFSHTFKPTCIKAIGRLLKKGEKDAINKLGPLAADKDSFIRKAVAYTLGLISDKANKNAVRVLKDMLEDENAEVRQEVIESLGKVADLEQLVTSLKANISETIRTALFQMIIYQIRESRQENPKFSLPSKQVKHLESLNCTEARFILLENYSV